MALSVVLAFQPCLALADALEVLTRPQALGDMEDTVAEDPAHAPVAVQGALTLGYNADIIYREKQDGALTHLHRIRGPLLSLAVEDWDTYFSVTTSDYTLNSRWADAELLSRLDGHRRGTAMKLGWELIDLGEERVRAEVQYGTGRLAMAGVLPTTLADIPGFDADDVAVISRDRQSWQFNLRYLFQGGSAYGSLGSNTADFAVDMANATDELHLRTSTPGRSWRLGLTGKLEQRVRGEVFVRHARASGADRIFHNGQDIGILRSANRSQWAGLRLSDPGAQQRWDFSVAVGDLTSEFSGSARLAGFQGSLLGITAPRGHLDAALSYRAVTLLADRWGGADDGFDWRYQLGVTRFDLDSRIDTWGTALFGAAVVDERSSTIPLEAGWLGHLGLTANWSVGSGDVQLSLSQNVPFSSRSIATGQAGSPLSPVHEVSDGGRVIGISYSIGF